MMKSYLLYYNIVKFYIQTFIIIIIIIFSFLLCCNFYNITILETEHTNLKRTLIYFPIMRRRKK